MRYQLNSTHDPNLISWIESANAPDTDFPIQNLPYCSFQPRGMWGAPRLGVAIGDRVIDLGALQDADLLPMVERELGVDVGSIIDLSREERAALRAALSRLLQAETPDLRDNEVVRRLAVFAMSEVTLLTPIDPPGFTDFYASVFHATNVGAMFRPDNPLLPNYKHVPIAYNGRASTVVASGTTVVRPSGQTMPDGASAPVFGPSKLLDYELELGFFVGRGNELGQPISIEVAEDHIFGVALVNDWSARDLQRWEYQPLGPFLAKTFATSVSPFVVTMEALAPFRCPAYERPEGDPSPLEYLTSTNNTAFGGIDLAVEAWLSSAAMREQGMDPIRISRGSFKQMYWTIAQMLTHHASNGCQMMPGDLLASGTISGPEPEARGCLLELTWDGPGLPRKPIALPTGETRVFLADGDEVIFRAYCERPGVRRIGLGECRGVIAPAVTG
jgi:fumarylacetoacetase